MNLLVLLTAGGSFHCVAVTSTGMPQALNNWLLAAAGTTGMTVAGNGSTDGATVAVSGTEALHAAGIEYAAEEIARMLPEHTVDLTGRLRHMTM